MKPIVYWIFVAILFLAEISAGGIALSKGEEGYATAGSIHLAVAALFGILIGIHRRSISISLLSVLVIATTPLIGLATMFLIDDKFNRETQERYESANEDFQIGNPFSSLTGSVEMADNQFLVQENYESILRRLTSRSPSAARREAEVLASRRDLASLPLLEKIASASSGETRVLAQAAISESSDRAAQWSRNQRRLLESGQSVPAGLERLSTDAFLRVRHHGRSAQAFSLPERAVLKHMLESRLTRSPSDMEAARLLCDLLIEEQAFDRAEELIEKFRSEKAFPYWMQRAKICAVKGDWIELLRTVPELRDEDWDGMSGNVKRFWGVA